METNAVHEVLGTGTLVKVVFIDDFGFCGRELHPTDIDLERTGVIEGNSVSVTDDEGCLLEVQENVLAGTEFPEETPVCYLINLGERKLQVMSHEIEVL
jgi:hypothetical protein